MLSEEGLLKFSFQAKKMDYKQDTILILKASRKRQNRLRSWFSWTPITYRAEYGANNKYQKLSKFAKSTIFWSSAMRSCVILFLPISSQAFTQWWIVAMIEWLLGTVLAKLLIYPRWKQDMSL
jgi:hypothetical protein